MTDFKTSQFPFPSFALFGNSFNIGVCIALVDYIIIAILHIFIETFTLSINALLKHCCETLLMPESYALLVAMLFYG